MNHTIATRLKPLFALALLASLISTGPLSAAEGGEEGWISLFNGKDLSGWKANENPETFRVEDGQIVVHGERAHLFYVGDVENHDFKNFQWKCEVMTKPGANSGMYFHTKYQDSGWPEQGYEVQVNATQSDNKKTGGLYAVKDVMNQAPHDDNEWFTQEVIVRGKHIVIKVNGEVTTDYTEPDDVERPDSFKGRVLSSGTFALQGHDPGSEVHYRSIMVKPLAEDVGDDDEAEGEWKTLFDGSSLDCWQGYNKPAGTVPDGWKIEDGTLTRAAEAGDLMTTEQYGDFELTLEWKISEGGNSGIIYRSKVTDQPSYVTGPEYQVLDNKAWKLQATDDTASGSLYGLYAPTKDVSRPAGEWNTARIVLHGNHVEHWLNGEKVVDAEIGSAEWDERVAGTKFAGWKGFAKQAKGHIVLQDHGHQVWFRNIKVRSRRAEQSAASDRPLRILMVTQSGGFQHSTITRKDSQLSHTERIMKQLGIQSGLFRVDCTKDVENDFKPELIENYDIVMFYTTGLMYNEDKRLPISEETMQWFLGTWLKEQGHAFLGVHSATDTFEDYEPYWDMIGGSFDGHPWTAQGTVTVKVQDSSHPAAAPWGESVTLKDEIYQFSHWQPEKVRVLMSLDMEQTELKKPYHVPVLWVKEYGNGRVMHMSMGHREDVWENPTYQESLLGGIRWLSGMEEADATPNPEVDARENEIARRAASAAAVN